MKKSELELLNDLVLINNDRMAVYQKAAACANEPDFATALLNVSYHCGPISIALNQAITNLGGDPATGTSLTGRLIRLWMGTRAFFGSKSRASIMNVCCAVDEIAHKALQKAVKETPAIRQMVHDQQGVLRESSTFKKNFEESPARGRPFAPHYKLI